MKYLVTSALPYANGKLHVGHLAGAYLPADIFVRYLRLKGEDVIYICGTDEHGTPISVNADAEGVTPEEIVQRYHDLIKEGFDGISIEFDNFSGTARPPHHILSQDFFTNLYEQGQVEPKDTMQFFCEHDRRFLPDRYVEGTCPKCGADGARGDQCDKCGQIYDTNALVEPRCKICGNMPVILLTRHWFLHLEHYRRRLKDWLEQKTGWKESVRSFILNLLDQELVERSITRDLSWGVPVPLPEAEGKVLYVWFDAPIGYISATVEWAERIGEPERWKDYWLDPGTRLVHFIGKDNIIFHAMIWPAMLMGQRLPYCLPYDIPANEFMNLEGQKISTSRNWAICVDEFVRDFDGEYLRYYLAVNAPESKDTDFAWKDFQHKVNGELNNVLGNLINRVLVFAHKHFGGVIRGLIPDAEAGAVLKEATGLYHEIDAAYRQYQVRKNTRQIMDIARLGNKYFDETKPWQSVRHDPEKAMQTLSTCLQLINMIAVALTPILPKSMDKLRAMISLPAVSSWAEGLGDLPVEVRIGEVTTLFNKVEDAAIAVQLAKLQLQSNPETASPETGQAAAYATVPPLKDAISYDDFARMDIRIAYVIAAERVPKTDKLMHLKVDIGSEQRELVAGVAEYYDPLDLIGKKIVMLVNLEPRKIRGILSQGMILCANEENDLALLSPVKDMPPGTVIY